MQRNIKLFMNKYKWDGIKYLSKIGHWKKFKNNNPTIVIRNVGWNCYMKLLYFNVEQETEFFPAYTSKYISAHRKQRILLMISNEEKQCSNYFSIRNINIVIWNNFQLQKHSIAFIPLEKKTNLNFIKSYVKTKTFVEL